MILIYTVMILAWNNLHHFLDSLTFGVHAVLLSTTELHVKQKINPKVKARNIGNDLIVTKEHGLFKPKQAI